MRLAGTIALVAGLLTLPAPLKAKTWTLLCSSKGQTVLLERHPEPVPFEAEARALGRYPGATCITLAPQTENQFGDISAPDAQSLAASTPTEAGSGGLGAALRALRGETLGSASRREPQPAEPGAQAIVSTQTGPATLKPRSQSWVRLGVYKSQDSMDALADWRRILVSVPALAYLVPAVTQTPDGWLMLSAGPIRDPIERNGLCVAVNSLDLDCIPGETPDSDPIREAKEAAMTMAASWPGTVIEWEAADQSEHVLGIEIENTTYADHRRGGLISWRSPFDAPRRFFDLANFVPREAPAADVVVAPLPPRRPPLVKVVRTQKPAVPQTKPQAPLDLMPKLTSTPPLLGTKIDTPRQAANSLQTPQRN
ncbi:hypothetical protein BSY19_5046 (plasmid) [Bosea sp. RAC05]|nr:hypothetical protein BSY19_5046 [Bosea sp. RAC05]